MTTKYQVTTDPEKMRELMLAYPRTHEALTRNSTTCNRNLDDTKYQCKRPVDHPGLLHVHAFCKMGVKGVQDPTTDDPRWQASEVAWWFDDARE